MNSPQKVIGRSHARFFLKIRIKALLELIAIDLNEIFPRLKQDE